MGNTMVQLRVRVCSGLMPTEENSMATVNAPTKLTQMNAKPAQIRLTRRSPAYWRGTIDNPPPHAACPPLLAGHEPHPADQRHGPGNGQTIPGSHRSARGR